LHLCLTKDRKQRLRDIGDARLDIQGALGLMASGMGTTSQESVPGTRRRISRREALAWALFAIAAVCGLGIWWAGLGGPWRE
jgi:hypothetical protein